MNERDTFKEGKDKPKSLPKTNKEFVIYLWREMARQKKWILLPVWVLVVLLALILLVSGHSAILPAIYLLF